MAENEHHQRGFTDHLHLINQVAHHDAALGAFGSRMSAVEGTLAHVQDKVNNLDMKVGAGFASLESLIRENKAASGPSLGELLKGIATGGAIVAMSAGAITMLVTSFVKPELVELRGVTSSLAAAEAERDKAEKEELRDLKTRRREAVDDAIAKMNAMNSWKTETRGGGS